MSDYFIVQTVSLAKELSGERLRKREAAAVVRNMTRLPMMAV
jgi:hypothetical protein